MNKTLGLLHGVTEDYSEEKSPRDGFGEALLELGEANKKVVALSPDVSESVRTSVFAQKYPERFIELGVAEQNLAGVSAGLALSGKIPFMAAYAVFSPGRNWDQLRVSICYSKANVKIIGSHAGLNVGEDGATHQALEDLAITRVLPNLTVISPCDAEETRKATIAVSQHDGPCYIRFGREKMPVITKKETPFEIGKALTIKTGKDVTIIATGQMVARAIIAAKELSGTVDAAIINLHTLKPIDQEAIAAAARQTKAVVTAEEHQVNGGLGSAVAEVLAKKYPVPMEMVAVNDCFGESGAPAELMDHYHLTARDIVQAIERVLKRKNASKL